MTAEELKDCVRHYAEEHLPGWACAAVSFRIGEIGAHVTESLVVLNQPDRPLASSDSTRG